MRKIIVILLFSCAALAQSDRIQLTVDSSEADAALAIASKKHAGQPIGDADWQRLFASEPYVRLKKREAALKRDFTDEQFKEFILSEDITGRAAELRRTLDAWTRTDLQSAAGNLLAYLPVSARIRAKIYPVIKPMHNTFVFETTTNPAIFLYLDPTVSPAQFANTVAHEMHHVGLASTSKQYQAMLKHLPKGPQEAAGWMGAFGEGMAMLAAAGGPDANPHAADSAEIQARWNRDMANFNADLKKVEAFFLDIVSGKLSEEAKIRERGFEFFGEQGPWYTVGYKMAVLVEKRFGRQALIQCMEDPRKLLASYNRAAAEISSEKPALWSADLLEAVKASPAN